MRKVFLVILSVVSVVVVVGNIKAASAGEIQGFKSAELGMDYKAIMQAIIDDDDMSFRPSEREWWDQDQSEHGDNRYGRAVCKFMGYRNQPTVFSFNPSWKLYSISVLLPSREVGDLHILSKDVRTLRDALTSKFGEPTWKRKDALYNAGTDEDISMFAFKSGYTMYFYRWEQVVEGNDREIIIGGGQGELTYYPILMVVDNTLEKEQSVVESKEKEKTIKETADDF